MRPSTLSTDFIRDLLAVTGGGRGKAFSDVRDHALIRVLTEGLRRTEVTQMRMTDLPLDLVSQRLIRVTPLKGARAEELGRVVLVAPATARAVAVYLRARRYRRLADAPYVWLGLRNGGRSTGWDCTGCCAGGPSRPGTSPRCTRTCSGTPWRTTGCPMAARRQLEGDAEQMSVPVKQLGLLPRSVKRPSALGLGSSSTEARLVMAMVSGNSTHEATLIVAAYYRAAYWACDLCRRLRTRPEPCRLTRPMTGPTVLI